MQQKKLDLDTLMRDEDMRLIGVLLLILVNEKADLTIIFALAYVLLF